MAKKTMFKPGVSQGQLFWCPVPIDGVRLRPSGLTTASRCTLRSAFPLVQNKFLETQSSTRNHEKRFRKAAKQVSQIRCTPCSSSSVSVGDLVFVSLVGWLSCKSVCDFQCGPLDEKRLEGCVCVQKRATLTLRELTRKYKPFEVSNRQTVFSTSTKSAKFEVTSHQYVNFSTTRRGQMQKRTSETSFSASFTLTHVLLTFLET